MSGLLPYDMLHSIAFHDWKYIHKNNCVNSKNYYVNSIEAGKSVEARRRGRERSVRPERFNDWQQVLQLIREGGSEAGTAKEGRTGE